MEHGTVVAVFCHPRSVITVCRRCVHVMAVRGHHPAMVCPGGVPVSRSAYRKRKRQRQDRT
jgi:hypothetical protein